MSSLDHLNGQERAVPYQDLYVYILEGTLPSEGEPSERPDYIGNWVEGGDSFLFFSVPADGCVAGLLKAHPGLNLIESHHFTYEDWQGAAGEPLSVAGFRVIPPWEPATGAGDGLMIRLDPGVVFGTGLHPTTRDCLKAIALTNQQEPFKNALDLGTGTGVLALAAAMVGAASVLAVDLNPLCVRTTLKNVRLNGLEKVIQVARGSAAEFLHTRADLVIANIHYQVIRGLFDASGFRDAVRLIISGLLRSQFRVIRERLIHSGFEIIQEWDQDMTWFTVLARRR